MKFDLNDIVGKKFGRWTVLSFHHSKLGNDNKHYFRFYFCKCDCGNSLFVERRSLLSGNSKSCGCLKAENAKIRATKHGCARERIYKIWCHIKYRCLNKNSKDYKDYGGRGIKICDDWLNDFKTFYDWSINNGYNDNLSIDRIDVNGNYEPTNCQWTDNKTQSRNKRNNAFITYNKRTLCLSDWAKIYKIDRPLLINRLKKGWSVEKALTTPVRHFKKK